MRSAASVMPSPSMPTVRWNHIESIVVPPGRQEGVGVGVAKPDDPARPGTCERSGAFSSVRTAASSVAHVTPRARLDDGHLRLQVGRQVLDRRALGQAQRLLGPAKRALAVGHHRQVVDGAVDPLGCAQLGERLGVLPRRVGGLTAGLTDHRDPRGAGTRRQRVLVGGLRVLVDQLSGRDEVPGDTRGQLLRESAQRCRTERSSSAPVIDSSSGGPS